MIEVDMRTKEQKREERKQKWREWRQKVIDWCCDHPVITLTIISGLFGFAKASVKSTAKAIAAHQDKVHTDYRIYDRATGQQLKLKRPLTTEQSVELDARHAQGETVTHALNEMGVLK